MAETPNNWAEAFEKLRVWDAEKTAILRALSDMDPTGEDPIGHFGFCVFCGVDEAPDGGSVIDHDDDCTWARARKLFPPTPPAPPEPQAPLRDFEV